MTECIYLETELNRTNLMLTAVARLGLKDDLLLTNWIQ